MTQHHDPLLDAIAGLRIVTPDGKWEKRVRDRCHSQISRDAAGATQSAKDATHRLTLADFAALAFLFVYLSALLQEAARLGGLL